MAFPVSPEVDEIYISERGTIFIWDGEKWVTTGDGGANFAVGATGATGPSADPSFYEQGELAAPTVFACDSSGFYSFDIGNSNFTTESKKSWQYTRLGNLVTITGYLQPEDGTSFGGPEQLGLNFNSSSSFLPVPNLRDALTINQIDHPSTLCQGEDLRTGDDYFGYFSRVPNKLLRNRANSGGNGGQDVIALFFEKEKIVPQDTLRMEIDRIDNNGAFFDVTIRYFTDNRVYSANP